MDGLPETNGTNEWALYGEALAVIESVGDEQVPTRQDLVAQVEQWLRDEVSNFRREVGQLMMTSPEILKYYLYVLLGRLRGTAQLDKQVLQKLEEMRDCILAEMRKSLVGGTRPGFDPENDRKILLEVAKAQLQLSRAELQGVFIPRVANGSDSIKRTLDAWSF